MKKKITLKVDLIFFFVICLLFCVTILMGTDLMKNDNAANSNTEQKKNVKNIIKESNSSSGYK